jgi:selenide,water dikinase
VHGIGIAGRRANTRAPPQGLARGLCDDRTVTAVKLTSLSHGAGCACKVPAALLAPLVQALPQSSDPNLLVGAATSDDAGIYRLRDDLALVQTADFFTPVVDDPYDFGRIAATNALSDVYAMGGRPVSALNLVAWSVEQLGSEMLGEVLRGGYEVVAAAGAAIVGGHTIDDPEPKYGLAVTGVIDPAEVITNAGGRAGDALVLTKPVGAGAVTTALKKGLADEGVLQRAVEVMTELNAAGARAARAAGAHAMTDVTGFGLLGHLHELTLASGVSAVVEAAAVPVIKGVLELLADDRAVAGGSRNNRRYAEEFASFGAGVEEVHRRLLTDAMTSGGLLVALDPGRAEEVPGPVIGRLVQGEPGTIAIV